MESDLMDSNAALGEEEPILFVSEDLAPSNVTQNSATLVFDFHCSLNLRLRTNQTECGGKIWQGGLVLAQYLIRHRLQHLKGKRILELGSGSGVLGLAIAHAVQKDQAMCPDTARLDITHVHLTDGLPTLMPLLEQNAKLNNLKLVKDGECDPNVSSAAVNVHVSPLSWGQPISASTSTELDIILAADCVYFEPSFPLLLNTLQQLMDKDTVLWLCNKKRRRADKTMVKMLKKSFCVREVAGDWEKEGVWLFEIVKKGSSFNNEAD